MDAWPYQFTLRIAGTFVAASLRRCVSSSAKLHGANGELVATPCSPPFPELAASATSTTSKSTPSAIDQRVAA